jgi:hypothetical protein
LAPIVREEIERSLRERGKVNVKALRGFVGREFRSVIAVQLAAFSLAGLIEPATAKTVHRKGGLGGRRGRDETRVKDLYRLTPKGEEVYAPSSEDH